MTDPYCATVEDACRGAHCIVCRLAVDAETITVAELLARRAFNGRIAARLAESRRAKPSPIVVGRFDQSVEAVSA